MKVFVAMAVGYLLGAKTGGEDLDKLVRSVKVLCQTDEFSDVVSASRAQMAVMLRELASIVAGEQPLPDSTDLVAQVRRLVGDD